MQLVWEIRIHFFLSLTLAQWMFNVKSAIASTEGNDITQQPPPVQSAFFILVFLAATW